MRYLATLALLLTLSGCVTRVVVQPCQAAAPSPNFHQPYICNEAGCKPLREFTYNGGTAMVSPPATTDVPK